MDEQRICPFCSGKDDDAEQTCWFCGGTRREPVCALCGGRVDPHNPWCTNDLCLTHGEEAVSYRAELL